MRREFHREGSRSSVPLLNRSEEITYNRLRAVAGGNGAHVFAKVRVADVVPLSGSSISDDLFSFGLRAHFDFTVTSASYDPLFVVEFDGPLHSRSEIQKRRDEYKNTICEYFSLPLLRINSRYIDREYRGLDLLTYFTDVWFLNRAFDEAQSKGTVPYDEAFDANLIFLDGRSEKRFPYWLALDVQNEFLGFNQSGLIRDYVLSHWVGIDVQENCRALAWLHVDDEHVLLTQTGMRHQLFPVDVSDILCQISAFDIRRYLDGYLKNRSNLVPVRRLESLINEYKKEYRLCSFGGSSKYH